MTADTGKVASAAVSDLEEITSVEDPINRILRAHDSGAVGLVAAADQLEKALEGQKAPAGDAAGAADGRSAPGE